MKRRAVHALLTVVLGAASYVAVLPSADTASREAAGAPIRGREYAVWVFLDPEHARSELPPAIAPDVQARRRALDNDRPINPRLIQRLAATGARIRYPSRWLRAVAVDADSMALTRIASLPEVRGIVPLRQMVSAAMPSTTAFPSAQQQDSAEYGVSWPFLRELNLPVLHSLNFTGAIRRIAILDTGFSLTHETTATRTVYRQRDFVNGDTVVSNQPGDPTNPNPEEHGTQIWSLLGGYAPRRMIGGAYAAEFILAKVDVPSFVPAVDTSADEDRWVAAVEWADSLGAELINSSIGFRNFVDQPPIPYGDLDGNKTPTTLMADEAARRGILVIVAVGNAGPSLGSLWAPADADSVIAVGGSEPLTSARIAVAPDISSRGPTADGRLKPDMVARGTSITAAFPTPFSQVDYQAGLAGSSYATPLITAGAALYMEAWPNDPIMSVRAALRLAGSNARAPNNAVGFGLPDVAAAVMLPQGLTARIEGKDLQEVLTSVAPRFEWSAPQIHPSFLPIRFVVEVAPDSLFTNPFFRDSVSQAFFLNARQPLRPMARAYWRITAVSPQGVRRPAVGALPIVIPHWVRLLTLTGPQTDFIDEPRPELAWVALQAPSPVGPFRYDVEVLSSSGEVVQQARNLTTSSWRVPQTLTPNLAYRWRVIARSAVGPADTVESMGSGFVVLSSEAPPATILYQNFPNPFPNDIVGHSKTRIWFDLAQGGPVELAVYDLRGRLIRQLIPSRSGCSRVPFPPGLWGRTGTGLPGTVDPTCALMEWDGNNERGDRAAPGVYLLRLRAGGVDEVRHMLFRPDRS